MSLQNPEIALVTIITGRLPEMKKFYSNTLGFSVKADMENYVEFNTNGVRFALCHWSVMHNATGVSEYEHKSRGHPFELAFPVDSADDVDTVYTKITSEGATPIKEPADMPWGQRTAFFADPDGHIHEIFAEL